MRLALSSAALPELDLTDLLEACARRGILGLELVSGHAHGVAPGMSSSEVARMRRQLAVQPVRLTALYLTDSALDDLAEYARLAVTFGVPLVAPVRIGSCAARQRAAMIIAAEGGKLLIRHGMAAGEADAADEVVAALGSTATGRAWEIRPGHDDPATVAAILDRTSAHLRYVRLHGGGPEAAEQGGRGVGPLMTRLALTRFAGPIVLTPSTPTYHYAWRAWLGRAGSWGCGSKSDSGSIHSLQFA